MSNGNIEGDQTCNFAPIFVASGTCNPCAGNGIGNSGICELQAIAPTAVLLLWVVLPKKTVAIESPTCLALQLKATPYQTAETQAYIKTCTFTR